MTTSHMMRRAAIPRMAILSIEVVVSSDFLASSTAWGLSHIHCSNYNRGPDGLDEERMPVGGHSTMWCRFFGWTPRGG